MNRSLAIGVVLFFLAGQSLAQVLASPERSAANNLAKKRWSKAETQLRKTLRKDSLNVVARYLLSLYFFKPDNPAYSTDSSYRHIILSLSYYALLSSREQEKMKRFPLDTARMTRLRERIDSAVFAEVKARHTEEAYILFLEEHPFAHQRNEALQLRDEVAYLNALNKNTHEAFLDFLNKYPLAANVPEAKKKYERLLYEARTSDRHLASYENFLREYPETPFRKEIEQHIFELFTRSGEIERYLSFLQLYPSSHLAKKAQDILFHILQEQEDQQTAGLFLTDSLRQIVRLQESYLVPFLRNNKFGFMDKNGNEVIAPALEELGDDYKCGNITEDIIALPGRILARNGRSVFSGESEEIDDIGSGFLKINSRGCNIILHKSGFIADSCVAHAKVLNNRFLAILKDQQWTLAALNGKRLLPETWDEVAVHSNVTALKKNTQWYLVTLKQLAEASEEYVLPLPTPYEEVKMLPHGLLWAKAKGVQGILDQTLREVIPVTDHLLTPSFFGFTGLSSDGYSIYDLSGKQSSSFDKVVLQEPWIAVRKNGSWYLFDAEVQAYQSPAYDSIRFEGPFVLGVSSDTLSVHFSEGPPQLFQLPLITSFIPGKDSTSFLSIEKEGKKTIYSAKGKKLFTVAFDQVQYAGQDLFIVHKKEKKGLINSEGKMILPVEYDAIGGVTNQVISLLRSMKFGVYHVEQRKLIKPQYDKNLIPCASRLIAAYDKGVYHFINWDNKPEGTIEFDEIQYWNDTTALVKKSELWSFYTFATKEIHYPNLKAITLIRDTPDEKLAIVCQENAFGVLSNKRGRVIPLTFTDLVNVGSKEEPLYFTEKHVEEASVFVVIYYDRNGKFLRREVYQEPDDYERIYCPDN